MKHARLRKESCLAKLTLISLLTLNCVRGRVPSVELYRLSASQQGDGVEAPAGKQPLRGGLAISPYVTRGLYSDAGIVYNVDEVSYGIYPNREWAIPLGDMLGVLTETALKARPLGDEAAIFDPPSLRHYTYLWRGSVREFEEVNRGRTVLAAVALDAQLVRVEDDSVLWRGTKRLEREVTPGTMPAIVLAMSELANEVIWSLIEEARVAAETLQNSRTAKPNTN